MKKILVTPRSVSKDGHPALEKLRRAGFEVVFCTPGVQPSEQDLMLALPNCVGFLAGVEPISEAVLEKADKLKVISRNGAGINNIDQDAAKRLGIQIRNAPGANARGVAELTLAHIMASIRAIPFHDGVLKCNDWQRRKGMELEGKTLGLIGCGNIGKIVARFGLALGMFVRAYDPWRDTRFSPGAAFSYVGMDEIWAQADIISLHCAAPSDGRAIVNAETITKMKDGVVLINTARAELVDDVAVAAGLESGKIAGLTLDVFHSEPPEDKSLLADSRVIATPHIGGFTNESVDRAVEMAVDNLLEALSE